MAVKDGTFTLDDAVFKKKMRDLARRHGVDEKEFVREQGGFLARDLARFTPPYASFPRGGGSSIGTGKDKVAGEKAIRDDLRAIFHAKDQGFIDFCAKRFGVGQVNQPMRGKGGKEYRIEYRMICRSIGDMKAWHSSQQNSRGRVKWKRSSIETAWVSHELFNQYHADQRAKVGIAKAELAFAAVQLNPKIKVPAWVRRHFGRVSGRGIMDPRKGSPTARIHAKASGLQHVLRTDILRRVEAGRLKAMETRLKKMFGDNARKSGFKTRG